ncbi:MAG: signal peptidase I [Spirochaetaceae bacterium]|nr:signal peptidase I [Spirochaetaceae bacterium]
MSANNNSEKKSHFLLFILAGIFIGIILKLFVFDVLRVEGTSMEPAIQDGNTVIVFKLAYGLVRPFSEDLIISWAEPKPGDIVLYFYNNRAVIKRCVAVAGEPLDFSFTSGYSLLVGGKEIPLTENQYQRIKHSHQVPNGMILAIGDNYSESIDSRNYGFVSVDNILGKVLKK